MKKIYVLHEYGAKSHYRALQYLCENNNIQLIYREFGFLRKILKSVLTMNGNLFLKQIKNICFLVALPFLKNKKILLGIAPYDFRLLALKPLLSNHNVYYHTSWVKWDRTFFPKKKFVTDSLVSFWEDFLRNNVLHIFAVSNQTKVELIKNLKINNSKISVVYHSFDEKIFWFNDSMQRKTDFFKFLYVGRLVEQKGITEILNYFSCHQKFNLTVVGKGKLKKLVENYARKFKNIQYLGYVSEQNQLATIYQQNDFLLLNSKKTKRWEELFGIVIIEAMACGVVPIASRHAGPNEIITNGENGFLINENDFIKKLDEVIKYFLHNDFKTIQCNVVQTSKKFTLKAISKKWESILKVE